MKKNHTGRIIVYSFLDDKEKKKLSGIKINLYKINGISPCLEETRITDENGRCEFKDMDYGNYRIIEIIDKKIYNKPKYKTWNDVNLTKYNDFVEIYVINSIRNKK